MDETARPSVLADAGARVEGLVLDALAYIDEEDVSLFGRDQARHCCIAVREVLTRYSDPRFLPSQPSLRAQVDALILEEMTRMDVPDYLGQSHLRNPAVGSRSALVAAELARLEKGDASPSSGVDASRYEMPQAPTGAAAEDPLAWEEAIKKAEIALEAQTLRAINLELASKYGVDAWKAAAEDADRLASGFKARVADLAHRADTLNAQRKAEQERHGPKLKALARRYDELVSASFATELACAEVEADVKRRRRAHADREDAAKGGGGGGGGARGAGAGTAMEEA
jgi:hypothetical protein